MISNAERQARWRAVRDAEIEAVRAATIKAELALAHAENHLLRQRVLDLETELARRESAAKSAQTKAASEIACLKEKNKELQSQASSHVGLVQQRDHKRGWPDLQGKQSDREGAASRRHAKRGGQAGSVQGVLGVEGRQGCGATALVPVILLAPPMRALAFALAALARILHCLRTGLFPVSTQPEPCFARLHQEPRTGYWLECSAVNRLSFFEKY